MLPQNGGCWSTPQNFNLSVGARDSHMTAMRGGRQGDIRGLQNEPWEPRGHFRWVSFLILKSSFSI